MSPVVELSTDDLSRRRAELLAVLAVREIDEARRRHELGELDDDQEEALTTREHVEFLLGA